MAEIHRPNSILRPFGKPIDLEVLLEIAEIDEDDIDDALQWWDSNASPDWIGVLNNETIDDLSHS